MSKEIEVKFKADISDIISLSNSGIIESEKINKLLDQFPKEELIRFILEDSEDEDEDEDNDESTDEDDDESTDEDDDEDDDESTDDDDLSILE